MKVIETTGSLIVNGEPISTACEVDTPIDLDDSDDSDDDDFDPYEIQGRNQSGSEAESDTDDDTSSGSGSGSNNSDSDSENNSEYGSDSSGFASEGTIELSGAEDNAAESGEKTGVARKRTRGAANNKTIESEGAIPSSSGSQNKWYVDSENKKQKIEESTPDH